MPSNLEIRTEQKRRLTMLLRLEAAKNTEKHHEILKSMITDTVIEMEAEDVAYVQKNLEESLKAST